MGRFIEEEHLERVVAERTAALKERTQELTLLASELTLTERPERRRLAQVLHDNLQQLLVGAKFGLEALARKLALKEVNGIREIERLLDQSIEVSRSLTVELSPPILHEAGLAAGLEWLARWMKEKRGLTVELSLDLGLVVEREDLRVLLFEAIRELLYNVVRHAGTDRAMVSILRKDGLLETVVEDKGVGFSGDLLVKNSKAAVGGGFGLFNVRERLALAGGHLRIESAPGQGTRITLVVPIAV